MGAPAKWRQQSFHGYADDDVEGSATSKAATNVNWTQDVDENFRVRFLIQNYGGTDASVVAQLQYNLNAAGWNNVTNASSVCISVTSVHFADAAATTQQIGAGTFNTGEFDEDEGATGSISVPAGQETEVEFVIQIVSGDVVDADTLALQLVDSGDAAYDNYANSPSITVNEAGAPTPLNLSESDDLDAWLDNDEGLLHHDLTIPGESFTLTDNDKEELGILLDITTDNNLDNWDDAFANDILGFQELGIADSFALTDDNEQILGYNWITEDTLSLSDAQKYILSYRWNQSDDLDNWLDSFSLAVTLFLDVDTDSLANWLDAFDGYSIGAHAVAIADSFSLSDANVRQLGLIWLPSDSFTLTDNLSQVLEILLNIPGDQMILDSGIETDLQVFGEVDEFHQFRIHYGIGIGIGKPKR
jgi:hypothetical protein